MNAAFRLSVLVIVSLGLGASLMATDVYYFDAEALSPNGKFKVMGVSPDNAEGDGSRPFADKFVYTLSNPKTGKVLWTRQQKDSEGSCGSVYVNDRGWVVICTGWDHLIVVDPDGKDRGSTDLLDEGMNKKDRKDYVAETTAGPMWASFSQWYFITGSGEKGSFVVRPWWGRRMIIDLAKGGLVEETKGCAEACLKHETEWTMDRLKAGIDESGECESAWPVLRAVYLAGRLGIEEAIPFVKKLQDSDYSGSSTMGGLGFGLDKVEEGFVNPHNYSTFSLRQVAALTLRRLGESPRQVPIHEFDVRNAAGEWVDYELPELKHSRDEKVPELKKGLGAREVLSLVGAPDYVGYDTWSYDLDGDGPKSLEIKWDEKQVIAIKTGSKPLWKDGFVRDLEIVQ